MNESMVQKFLELMLRFQRQGDEVPPFETYGISPAQVVYVDYLARHAPCSLKQLTEGLGFRPASVSVMIKMLEQKNMISREVNPDDKRSIILSLSERGQRTYAKIDQFRKKKADALLAQLSDTEVETFLALLQKMVQTNT